MGLGWGWGKRHLQHKGDVGIVDAACRYVRAEQHLLGDGVGVGERVGGSDEGQGSSSSD